MSENLIAFRGTIKLKDDVEITAHLATLLRMENVGVLLGAGASVACGGKTMAGLWSDFKSQSSASYCWLKDQKFITENDDNDLMATSPPPNVEALLDILAISLAEWARSGSNQLDDGREARQDIYRAVVRAALLDDNNWSLPPTVNESGTSNLDTHKLLLQKLIAARQPGQGSPWIFTTNYDLAIEWAADAIELNILNGFQGLHTRRFSPQSFDLGFRNTQARGEAQFGSYAIHLAKLHGSLTWKEISGQYYETQCSEAYSSLRDFADGKTKELAFTVLPSAAKYIQTIGFVLGELFRRFSEFLARSQSALFVSGYGFGDEHINRLLDSALLNPTFQLVIYHPDFSGINDTAKLPKAAQRIIALKNPRVTFVGGGSAAYFDQFVQHLPEPAIFNENLKQIEDRLRSLKDADPLGSGTGV